MIYVRFDVMPQSELTLCSFFSQNLDVDELE